MTLFRNIVDRFMYNKRSLIIIIAGILLVCSFYIFRFHDPDRIVKWHDDFVGWIVTQEMNTFYLEAKASELPDLTKLELDAEMIRSIKDLKYFRNLEELTLNVKNTKKLNTLQSLEKLDKLVVINGDTKTLKYISKLNITTLVLKNFTLSNVKSLAEMGNLSTLEIEDSYIEDGSSIQDLSGLIHLSLVNVSTDMPISLCKAGKYHQLDLTNVKIDDLGIVSQYTSLAFLKLEKLNLMEQVDLELPVGLEKVIVKECGVNNLKWFLSLPKLVSLDVSDNEIQDISNLTALNSLNELSIANNPIRDLSPIGDLQNSIKLNVSGISLNKEVLDLLSQMKLEELSVSNCGISELDFLADHMEIKRLDLSDNSIENIGILGMFREELYSLDISGNPINDLSPLINWSPSTLFYDEKYYSFEGVELDISEINMGKISDENGRSVIANMILRKLTARNCGLKNVELVAPHTKLQFLDISGNPIDSIEVLDTVKSLKYVIAKDTLITEDNLPDLTLPLTLPGTYGITALWKMPGGSFSYRNKDNKEWIRIVIK